MLDIFCKAQMNYNPIYGQESFLHRRLIGSYWFSYHQLKLLYQYHQRAASVLCSHPLLICKGWLMLSYVFHTYFLICPYNNPSRKRIKCILDEVSSYCWDLLSGMKAFPMTQSFWGKNGRTDLTSQTSVRALRFCHFASILAFQTD